MMLFEGRPFDPKRLPHLTWHPEVFASPPGVPWPQGAMGADDQSQDGGREPSDALTDLVGQG